MFLHIQQDGNHLYINSKHVVSICHREKPAGAPNTPGIVIRTADGNEFILTDPKEVDDFYKAMDRLRRTRRWEVIAADDP